MDVISRYSIQDALRDGILVDLKASGLAPANGRVVYCTRGVFERFVIEMGRSQITGLVRDVTRLLRLIEEAEMLAEEDKTGFLVLHGGVWAIRNEEGTYTLLLPEEY